MAPIIELFDLIKRKEKVKGPISYIVAGLGNPGPKYENTRHNIGFKALDLISYFNEVKIDKKKFSGLTAKAQISDKRCILVKPMTYMNESGKSIEEARAYYKLDINKIIVLVDDISLPIGKIRIRKKGSDGGHNGLKSIEYSTGSDEYIRIKIGVGNKPTQDYDLAKWVLSNFKEEDKEKLELALDNANEAVNLIVGDKIEEAMNKFN